MAKLRLLLYCIAAAYRLGIVSSATTGDGCFEVIRGARAMCATPARTVRCTREQCLRRCLDDGFQAADFGAANECQLYSAPVPRRVQSPSGSIMTQRQRRRRSSLSRLGYCYGSGPHIAGAYGFEHYKRTDKNGECTKNGGGGAGTPIPPPATKTMVTVTARPTTATTRRPTTRTTTRRPTTTTTRRTTTTSTTRRTTSTTTAITPPEPPPPGTVCPPGTVERYVLVENSALSGADAQRSAQFVSDTAQQCTESCSLNAAPSGETAHCRTAVYHLLTGTCTLTMAAEPPVGDATPTDNDDMAYYSKTCGTADVWSDCEDDGPALVAPGYVLIGFATNAITAPDRAACMEACADALSEDTQGFQCSSGMYFSSADEMNCLLNEETRDSAPDLYVRNDDDPVEYFEPRCAPNLGVGGPPAPRHAIARG